jgi:hypothetical protein
MVRAVDRAAQAGIAYLRGLEVEQPRQHLVLAACGLIVQEVAHHIEDRPVLDGKAHLDRLVADRLGQETPQLCHGLRPCHPPGPSKGPWRGGPPALGSQTVATKRAARKAVGR